MQEFENIRETIQIKGVSSNCRVTKLNPKKINIVISDNVCLNETILYSVRHS